MFLAWKEIRHQPLRFGLIVALISLMAYMTFFLSGLASGLAFDFRSGIEGLNANSIILTSEANKIVSASRLTDEQADSGREILGEGSSALVVTAAVSEKNGERVNVYIFGQDLDSFSRPEVVSGRAVEDPAEEVVVGESVLDKGYAIGDRMSIAGSSHDWTIVGLTKDDTFLTQPVVHVDRTELRKAAGPKLPSVINALVTDDEVSAEQRASLEDAGLATLSSAEFIDALPGYSVQTLTFILMIGALIIIAAIVLAIFIYVLTLQKRQMLGILKARGVSTSHLIASGAIQTTILSIAGTLIGLALAFLSALVLPDSMPFTLDIGQDLLITLGFVVFAVIGGLVSVRAVAAIDPVEAIA